MTNREYINKCDDKEFAEIINAFQEKCPVESCYGCCCDDERANFHVSCPFGEWLKADIEATISKDGKKFFMTIKELLI